MKAYLALISTAVLALSACGGKQEAASPAVSSEAAASPPAAPASGTAPAAPASGTAPAAPASGTAPAAPPSGTAPAASSAASTVSESSPAAEGCEVVVNSDDQMKFDKQELEIKKSCKEFKITLKHVGKMPKSAMGHNIVISKTEDASGVVSDGAGATAEKDFVKEGDSRVIAHTKLIGGGEETSVSVDPSKLANGNFEFYCTFPGHYGLMHGTIKLI